MDDNQSGTLSETPHRDKTKYSDNDDGPVTFTASDYPEVPYRLYKRRFIALAGFVSWYCELGSFEVIITRSVDHRTHCFRYERDLVWTYFA
jgi:hypothetical protein